MMEPWAQRIFERLQDFEGKKSQADLAKACRISAASVSNWFGKGSKPTRKIDGANLVAAAKFLETTPEWILTGRGQRDLSQAVGLDLEMLRSAIVSVKEALKALGLELDAFLAAPMIAYAYAERALLPRDMTKDEYRAFDEMVTAKLRGELGNVADQGSIARASQGRTKTTSTRQAKARSR